MRFYRVIQKHKYGRTNRKYTLVYSVHTSKREAFKNMLSLKNQIWTEFINDPMRKKYDFLRAFQQREIDNLKVETVTFYQTCTLMD